jgi:CO/xanthine dehydrogenase Mo-binding subunit
VRVVVGDVGGGFGMKTSVYPEDVVGDLRAHIGISQRRSKRRIELFGHGWRQAMGAMW